MKGPILVVIGCALAAAWISSACLVDRKSDALACSKPTDCTAPRVCEAGFCVLDPSACPTGCTSCDATMTPHVCQVTQVTGLGFTCPSGVECDITCATANACKNITCDPGSVCNVDCSVGNACQGITCNGRCDLKCDTTSACQAVTCSNACACDVTCGSGDCGTISCPREQGNTYCTASGNNGDECESTSSPKCDSC